MGGSFDPVHNGHLAIAIDALEQCLLDHVLWIPAATAPLRDSGPRVSGEARLEMVRLAIAGISGFSVDGCEIERGGVSYAVETAGVVQRKHPGSQLFWIIGEDQLGRLASWHRIQDLAGIVEFIVASRPNSSVDRSVAGMKLAAHYLKAREMDVSSTEIRQRIAAGKPVGHMVPSAVLDYIFSRKLYQSAQ